VWRRTGGNPYRLTELIAVEGGDGPAGLAGAQAPDLTAREREVLGLLVEGMANKQIARALGITDKTVKAHMTKIFAAIGVTDRTAAALWAHRNGVR
jgi:DNA-binding NarL/FixJ family response regulator